MAAGLVDSVWALSLYNYPLLVFPYIGTLVMALVRRPVTGAAAVTTAAGSGHEWWRRPGAEVVCNTGTLVYFAGLNRTYVLLRNDH